MDTVDKETRSRIMARIGPKDTGAEILLRRHLHKIGLRYRLHDRKLPGSPDIVFPRFRAVTFVHGCFWHAHGCDRSTTPKTRRDYWVNKFKNNKERDEQSVRRLLDSGWRVSIVWECALLGKVAWRADDVAGKISAWLHGKDEKIEIDNSGK